MPPKLYSRHEFTTSFVDEASGCRLLTDRVPYRYRDLSDNIHHMVASGDSLFTLSQKYYNGFTDRAAGFWWAIADFQPDPIIDPTLKLEEGTTIVVPSLRTLIEEILNPSRRELF